MSAADGDAGVVRRRQLVLFMVIAAVALLALAAWLRLGGGSRPEAVGGIEAELAGPDRVKRLVIGNTWCWPVGDDFHFRWFSFLTSSRIGQYLLRRHNIFVNKLMPMWAGNKDVLTPEIMAHYRNALPSPAERAANAALPGYIVGAGDWLGSIWRGRAAFADKPALIVWGHRDIAFRKKELDRWKSELSDVEVHEFEDCGHYLAEEAPEKLTSALRAFMDRT